MTSEARVHSLRKKSTNTVEQAWSTAVNDASCVCSYKRKDTPMMWSSFHAARSDVVEQPHEDIEALLPFFHEKAATSEMIPHGPSLTCLRKANSW